MDGQKVQDRVDKTNGQKDKKASTASASVKRRRATKTRQPLRPIPPLHPPLYSPLHGPPNPPKKTSQQSSPPSPLPP
eukprot:359258-Chlamydomonas_euryale.AAC.31